MSLKDNIRKTLESWNKCREERKQLRDENDKLRAFIADSTYKCLYCGLSKEDMARCPSGFPGCARADDLMNGVIIGILEPPVFDQLRKEGP